MDMIKKAGVIANDLIDSVSWLVNRMNSQGRDFNKEELVGASAEVTIPIQRGQTGEIMVALGRTLQNYPARSFRPESNFRKGDKVRIAEVGASLMFVDTFEHGEGKAQSPFTVIGEVEDSCE
jgi:hypothetical protein